MVPLALITKSPMKSLDVIDSHGASLSVLGRQENGYVGWSALVQMYTVALGHEISPGLRSALRDIVLSAADEAEVLAETLLSSGQVDGRQLLDPEQLPAAVSDMTRDLAANYLLVVLLDSERAGRRQLIKMSFHWHVLPAPVPSATDRLLIAAGYRAAPFAIEARRPADADSYHLEVHAPPGLECAGLTLPAAGGAIGAAQPDQKIDVVADAVGSFEANPSDGNVDAELLLFIPKSGLRIVAATVLALTAVVFCLEQLLPGARATLARDTGGSVAILLAAPAVVVALLSRTDENALASMLLMPLRAVVLGCALLLGAGAASFVGKLQQPYLEILWGGGAVLSLILAVGAWFAIAVGPSSG